MKMKKLKMVRCHPVEFKFAASEII